MTYDLELFVNIARNIFHQQTAEELGSLKTHFGKAYDEARIVAEIAVKMLARVANLPLDSSRRITPVDTLVDRGIAAL